MMHLEVKMREQLAINMRHNVNQPLGIAEFLGLVKVIVVSEGTSVILGKDVCILSVV